MRRYLYSCNLCQREKTLQNWTGDGIFGFRYTGGANGETVVADSAAENHICGPCLDNMIVLHRQVRKEQINTGAAP